MDRRALSDLRLDRRLLRRKNWLSDEERARALEELPDVSNKIAPPEDAETPPEAPSGE